MRKHWKEKKKIVWKVKEGGKENDFGNNIWLSTYQKGLFFTFALETKKEKGEVKLVKHDHVRQRITFFRSMNSCQKLSYKDFNLKANEFSRKYFTERMALESCLETRINEDINFICRKERSSYLKAVSDVFCVAEYEKGVKCQKAAGDSWAEKCFNENVAFGQCADSALKRLYVYNLENNSKNPAAAP